MVSALSDVLHEKHSSHWRRLNLENSGTADLIVKLETYLYTLASALELTSEQESPRPYNIITDSIGKRNSIDTFLLTAQIVCLDTQGSHRLEKYLNIKDCLEKSLKIKFAWKGT